MYDAFQQVPRKLHIFVCIHIRTAYIYRDIVYLRKTFTAVVFRQEF